MLLILVKSTLVPLELVNAEQNGVVPCAFSRRRIEIVRNGCGKGKEEGRELAEGEEQVDEEEVQEGRRDSCVVAIVSVSRTRPQPGYKLCLVNAP